MAANINQARIAGKNKLYLSFSNGAVGKKIVQQNQMRDGDV